MSDNTPEACADPSEPHTATWHGYVVGGHVAGRIPELMSWLQDRVAEQVHAAVAAEREACAKVAEGMHLPPGTREEIAADIAAAIRARKP